MMVRWSGEVQVNVSGMSGERQISIWAWHWWTWNLFRSTAAYCATLGHKCNHSFNPNCHFSQYNHPRWSLNILRFLGVIALPLISGLEWFLASKLAGKSSEVRSCWPTTGWEMWDKQINKTTICLKHQVPFKWLPWLVLRPVGPNIGLSGKCFHRNISRKTKHEAEAYCINSWVSVV